MSSANAEVIALRAQLQCVERDMWENKVRRADLTARLKERDRWIAQVRNSPAWKMLKPFWKLQRHFSKKANSGNGQRNPAQLVFSVDPPESSDQVVLRVKGWCFTQGGPETVGVRARLGAKAYFARYGLARPDLARTALDYPAALHSGFSVTIPLTSDSASFRLEAIAQGGVWECFFEHTIDQKTIPHHRSEGAATIPSNSESAQTSLVLYPEITAGNFGAAMQRMIAQLPLRSANSLPACSVITPLPHFSPRQLAEAGAGLFHQSLQDWEWLLPAQQNPEQMRMLEELARLDGRVRMIQADVPGANAACNTAVKEAKSETVCFLRPQDILHPEALFLMLQKLEQGFDIVYSDEDKFDEDSGLLLEPFFKPEWSPEYLRGAMYIGPFFLVGRQLAAQLRFDPAFEQIAPYDFILRAGENGARVGHVAKTLYHSRKSPPPIDKGGELTEKISSLQQKAVNNHLQRLGLPARAEPAAIAHRLRIVPAPRAASPRISIIIPTKDSPALLSRCLHSLYQNTSYSPFETILIDNDTSHPQALAIMRDYPVSRVYLPNPFNFSRANNLAARHATGEYLVFLNNDTEIITARWLEYLLYYAEQPDIGAAGALLLHDNGSVQHGGVILGMHGTADHAMRGFSARSDGYLGSLTCAREVSAVTAACMMMRKSLFDELEGFNEHYFTIYQDLDLCLRLRQRGLRIIWAPQVVLLHHESISRQKYYDIVDRYLLLDRWQEVIEHGDPYYNSNLNLERGDYSSR